MAWVRSRKESKRHRQQNDSVYKRRKNHALRRLLQRYSIVLAKGEYSFLCENIKQQRKAVFLDRKTNTATHWAVWYNNQWLMAVYLTGTHQITTFLPTNRLDRYQEQLRQAEQQFELTDQENTSD